MSQSPVSKRSLEYADLDAMLADVETLLEQGYVARGQWSLGQACSHVADWARFPMDGFPKAGWAARCMMWLLRISIAKRWKRQILEGGFKPGMPTDPRTVPDADETVDRAGFEKLRETVERLRAYDGPLHPSPLFGPMDKETLVKVTLLHAAHHFGYLEPKPTQSAAAGGENET